MHKQSLLMILTGLLTAVLFFPANSSAGGVLGHNSFNAGNFSSEVWNNGVIGDTTGTSQIFPSGWYPFGTQNSYLKFGGFWFGASDDGGGTFGVSAITERDDGIILTEWQPSLNCSTVTSLKPGSRAIQELRCQFDDRDSSFNQGKILNAEVTFCGHQWSFAPIQDFYIVEYTIKNAGSKTLSDAYVGFYQKTNVVKTPSANADYFNYVGYDTTADDSTGQPRNMIWVTADSNEAQSLLGFAPGYVGIRLLEAKDQTGTPLPLRAARWWLSNDRAPRSDNDTLDVNNRYRYLSKNVFDAGDEIGVNRHYRTIDSLHFKIPDVFLKTIEGVWTFNDTFHLGTNYFSGGSFVPQTGWVTLGTPLSDRLIQVTKEEDWATDSIYVTIQTTPLYSVGGVWDNSGGAGTNYFTGGSFDAVSGVITLGTPFSNWGSAPLYIDYVYKGLNVTVSFRYYFTNEVVTPSDSVTLTISKKIGFDEVKGVYWPTDTLQQGTNYFTGGWFEKATGVIHLGTPIPDTSKVVNNHETSPWDSVSVYVPYSPSDKVDSILGVYANTDTFHTGTNYYLPSPPGSYDPPTGLITLGTQLPDPSQPVFVCYRYRFTPKVIASYHYNQIGYQHILETVGPLNLAPGDTSKMVFCTAVGQTLRELQVSSDLANYMWSHPGYLPASATGSISGQILRTEGRGGIENAKVILYQGGISVDSTFTATDGNYTIPNKPAGLYDSLRAFKSGYGYGAAFNVNITGGKDTSGVNIILPYLLSEIVGQVKRSDGVTPVSEATVTLKGVNNIFGTTQTNGRYHLSGLTPTSGDTLFFSKADFKTDTLYPVALYEDSIKVQDAILQYLFAEINGKVTRTDGLTPIPNAVVRLDTSGAIGVAYDTTDADGNYDLLHLNPTSYKLVFSASGFISDSISPVITKVDSISVVNFALGQSPADGSLRWITKTEMPSWRYALGTAIVNSKIYVIGGADYLANPVSAVWEYNPAADTINGSPWATKAPLPTPRYGLTCISLGDSIIYAIGGYDVNGNALSTVEAYKPFTDTWLTGFAPMPTPRAFLGIGALNDTIYAVGGENNSIAGLDTVEAYAPLTNSWTTKKSLLGGPNWGRSGLTCATPDSAGIFRLHAIGGKKIDGTYMEIHQKYNQTTNTWISRTVLPTPYRAFLASAIAYDSIYCLGGRDSSAYYDYTVTYNPYGNNWKTETSLLNPRAYFASVAIEGSGIYAFGGKSDDSHILKTIEKGFRYGSISGQVRYTSGVPIPGVTVTAIAGGEMKNSETSAGDGRYTTTYLEPGIYKVKFFKTGLIDTTLYNIQVVWGKDTPNVDLIVTGVETEPSQKPRIPLTFGLSPAYPNPFRSNTTIRYQLPTKSKVSLKVYNLLGQVVRTLVNEEKETGYYSLRWDGRNDETRKVASGVYFYRLEAISNQAQRFTATKKMILLH
ncbi:MAG: carboxypeptidase regulatory-like domain-containing protein [Candidatus Edwardsbacteria bacterium]